MSADTAKLISEWRSHRSVAYTARQAGDALAAALESLCLRADDAFELLAEWLATERAPGSVTLPERTRAALAAVEPPEEQP